MASRQEWPTVYWEDVAEGQELPPISLDVTIKRCIVAVAATRDFYDIHHNQEFARASGVKDIFVNTMFNQGLAGRFMTDWSGPEGEIRRLQIAMRESTYPGDVVTVTGKVTKKYVSEAGDHLVDLDILIANPRGPAVIAAGTIALPTRDGAARGAS